MSIYIKGMEMPTDVTLLAISPDGTVDIISGQLDLSWETLKDKAICVPPHGRLIDANALCDGLVSNHPVVIHAKSAPTVIEAEDGE